MFGDVIDGVIEIIEFGFLCGFVGEPTIDGEILKFGLISNNLIDFMILISGDVVEVDIGAHDIRDNFIEFFPTIVEIFEFIFV